MSRQRTTRWRLDARLVIALAGAGVMGLGLAVPHASAQNALGDGRGLDSSLRTGTGGYNGVSSDGRALDFNLRELSGGFNDVGRSFRAETAFRNAIVTGNVAAGREFRGSVGYTAADDFRGFLGSNANFRFERDSFYSGLATRNLSGIESIRNPLAYTVAGQRDSVFGGGLIVNRAGVGATGFTVDMAPAARPNAVDVYGNLAGSLRSPSVQIARSERIPELIASAPQGVVTASPLIGIRPMRWDSPMFTPSQAGIGTTTRPPYETPSAVQLSQQVQAEKQEMREQESDRRVSSPYQVVVDSLRGAPLAMPVSSQDVATIRDNPDIATIGPDGVEEDRTNDRSRFGTDQDAETDDVPVGLTTSPIQLPKFDQGLEQLRSLLQQARAADDEDSPLGGADASNVDEEKVDEEEAIEEQPLTAPEIAAQILAGKSAYVIELANPPTPGNIFGEHMRRGQMMMEDERYFDAEERFTAALAVRPGDPMAAAARVNAQLAAGMFRSASVNLRNLLQAYPELMVTRFDEKLIGPKSRTDRIRAQLIQRMELSTSKAREAGLLLAYECYQAGDTAGVQEAFNRLDQIISEMESSFDSLEQTLRVVWMTPVEPSPAPDAPASEP